MAKGNVESIRTLDRVCYLVVSSREGAFSAAAFAKDGKPYQVARSLEVGDEVEIVGRVKPNRDGPGETMMVDFISRVEKDTSVEHVDDVVSGSGDLLDALDRRTAIHAKLKQEAAAAAAEGRSLRRASELFTNEEELALFRVMKAETENRKQEQERSGGLTRGSVPVSVA